MLATGASFTGVIVTVTVAVFELSGAVVRLEGERVGAVGVGVRRVGERAGRRVRDGRRALRAVGDDAVGQRVAVDVGSR